MTIVSITETLTYLDEVGSNEEDRIQDVLTEVETYVSTFCRRTFESTSYSLERYNGKGYQTINLNQYPVTIVDRVAIGFRNAISIKNTNTGTSASVSVSSTGLRLILDGTADSADLTFVTNATISSMVTAINAIGSGWVAVLENSTYGSFKSSDLITQSALGCINSRLVYLTIPDEQEYDIEVDLDRGQIKLPVGFGKGFKNVFVDYTAGYSAANMPDDLKMAVKIIVQYIYTKLDEGIFGVDLFNLGASGSTGLRTVFEKYIQSRGFILPREAEIILSHYKRRLV